MNVEVYDYEGLGTIIDPESDTKVIPVILIGKQTVKCNPRPAVIYISGGKVTADCAEIEKYKAYCAENKIMLVCPVEAEDYDELGKTYAYLKKNYKDLNILEDQISVKADEDKMEGAQNLIDYALDEYDTELDEAEVFAV